MKRTTIFLDESIERDLQLYARRKGLPMASVVREAIAAYVVEDRHPADLPSFAGAFDSGHTDTAERHEELLFGSLTPHGAASRKATPLPKRATVRLRRARATRSSRTR